MVKSWEKHIDRLRSQITELRETLRVIKDTTHEERPGLEETTLQFRDLVGSAKSQQALYQFPKILQSILVNPAIGAIVFGPSGEQLLFNAAAERILGSDLMRDTQAEKSGNFGFYLEDKTTRYTKEQLPWQLAVLGHRIQEVTLFVRRQGVIDGIWVKVTCTALKNELSEIGGAVAFLADTTEQVKVEQQIESLCDHLEQQFSLLGSAQFELKLLTDKLAKIEWSTDSPADVSKSRAAEAAESGEAAAVESPLALAEAVAARAGAPAIKDLIAAESAEAQASGAEAEVSEVVADAEASEVVAAAAIDAEPVVIAPDVVSEVEASDVVSEVAETVDESEEEDTEASAAPTEEPVVEVAPPPAARPARVGRREAAEQAKAAEAAAAKVSADTDKSQRQASEKQESKAARELKNLSLMGDDDESELDQEEELDALVATAKSTHKKSAAEILVEKMNEELGKGEHPEQESFEPDTAEPAADVKAAQSAQPASVPAEINKKILIVDDIPVNQKLLRLQLKRLGFESFTANNGEAAIDTLKNNDFALILMDLDMPIMDGYESTVAIRKLEEGTAKHVPIVAMTSYDREGDREKCLSIGMDDFLNKGATQKQLKEVIDRCVQPPKEADFWGTAAPINTAPPEKESNEPILNIQSLQKQFDKEEVQDVSRLFLSAVHTFIDCIQLGIEEKDAGAVTHFAHSVKGPCAALGIDEMTRLTSEIMSNAESGNWTQVRVKYMKLKSSFGEVRDQLRELCRPDYLLTS